MTKKDIIKKTSKLFEEFGLKIATMDRISSHLGVSKKTLYKHFSNKEDIINYYLKYSYTSLIKEIESKFDLNPIEYLVFIDNLIVDKILAISPIVLEDIKKYYIDSEKIWKRNRAMFIMRFAKLLDEGKNKKLFISKINSKLLAELRLIEIELIWKRDGIRKVNVQKSEQTQLFDHFMRGILI